MRINRKNIDYIILLSFNNFSNIAKKLKYLVKSAICLFYIYRKLKRKQIIKLFYLFIYKTLISKYKIILHICQINLCALLYCLLCNLNNKYFQVSISILFDKASNLLENTWFLKKEYLALKFSKINFLILFDKLKSIFKSKKILLNLFEYYQINQDWLTNQIFFQNFVFIYLLLSLTFFDNFVSYLFQQLCKIFTNKLFVAIPIYVYIKKKMFSIYIRRNNSFFISLAVKNLYIKQVTKELLYFLKYQIKAKIKNDYLAAINNKVKKIYFIGYYLTFFVKRAGFMLKANVGKIFVRFLFLGYINKFSKPMPPFVEYLTLNQQASIIKLKLILQSLYFYYNVAKDKKHMVFKIILIFKIAILKVFISKFKYKSRAQILNSFKTDFSKRILIILQDVA